MLATTWWFNFLQWRLAAQSLPPSSAFYFGKITEIPTLHTAPPNQFLNVILCIFFIIQLVNIITDLLVIKFNYIQLNFWYKHNNHIQSIKTLVTNPNSHSYNVPLNQNPTSTTLRDVWCRITHNYWNMIFSQSKRPQNATIPKNRAKMLASPGGSMTTARPCIRETHNWVEP